MQQQLVKGTAGEEPVHADMKRWLELDRLIRREETRKVQVGQSQKTKFSFEYTPDDWISLMALLPDVIAELDEDIARAKQENKHVT